MTRRERIEAVIERLIAKLDDMDGDCDLEDGDDIEAAEADENENEPYCGFARDYWGEVA